MVNLSNFSDTFDSKDETKWEFNSNITVAGGKATAGSGFSSMISTSVYTLDTVKFEVEVPEGAFGNVGVRDFDNGDDFAYFSIDSSSSTPTIQPIVAVGGSVLLTGPVLTYIPGTYQWLRIDNSGGEIKLYVSSSGFSNWDLLWSVAGSMTSLVSVFMQAFAGMSLLTVNDPIVEEAFTLKMWFPE